MEKYMLFFSRRGLSAVSEKPKRIEKHETKIPPYLGKTSKRTFFYEKRKENSMETHWTQRCAGGGDIAIVLKRKEGATVHFLRKKEKKK